MLINKVSYYKIIEKIGEGGMGTVFKAEDTKLHRKVALKFLNYQYSFDDEFKQRLQLEAQAASALQHNNICTIHEISETEDGQLFIVMDLYNGKTLNKKLEKGPLDQREFFSIAIQIADGISKANESGIIHRDLKPANIFITDERIVKILDFGIAQFSTQAKISRTSTIGTVAYMSPEQLRGEVIDYTSDIWALGLILYEMLTGINPFKEENEQATIFSILNNEIRPVKMLKPEVSDELNTLIMDCLIKDKNERCQSAAEIYRKLKILSASIFYSKKKNAVNTSPYQEDEYEIRSNTIIMTAHKIFLTFIICSMAATIYYLSNLLMNKPGEIDLSKYKFTALVSEVEPESNAIWSPDGRSIAYTKRVYGYYQIFIRNLEHFLPTQITFLEKRHAGDQFWDPKGNLIYFISQGELFSVGLTGGEPKFIKDSVGAATISKDSKYIVYWRPEKFEIDKVGKTLNYLSVVRIYSLIDKTDHKYSPAPFELADCFGRSIIKFSPDGKKIGLSIYGSDCKSSEIWILPWPNNEKEIPVQVFEKLNFLDSPQFSWMPDSKRMFVASHSGLYDQKVFLGDTETNLTKCILVPFPTYYIYGDVSPDGNSIALTNSSFLFNVAEVPLNGSPPKILKISSNNDYSLNYSSDGLKSVYITDKNGTDEIWLRINNEDIRPIVTKTDFPGDEPVLLLNANISPDGKCVAFRVGRKDLGSKIFLVSSIGRNPVRLTNDIGFEDISSWSNDSKYLAFAYNEYVSIVKVGTQEPPKVLYKTNDYRSWVSWSPDDKMLSYFNDENIVLISLDGETKRYLTNPIPHGNINRVMVWPREGKYLYLASTHGGMMHLYKVNVLLDKNELIAEYESDLIISGFNWAAIFGTLSPDGKSIILTTAESKSDIYLFEGFSDIRLN